MLYWLVMKNLAQFRATVRAYYEENKRDLPWRVAGADGNFDSYKILISEIMLQQTQVGGK